MLFTPSSIKKALLDDSATKKSLINLSAKHFQDPKNRRTSTLEVLMLELLYN